VKAALEKMDIMTFYGRIKFDTGKAHGKQIGHEMVYLQWQKDASGNLIRPHRLAGGRPGGDAALSPEPVKRRGPGGEGSPRPRIVGAVSDYRVMPSEELRH
jgi:hypothetical protein